MQSLQSIKRRIRGVESTKQITNSMQMVSSSKVQHAREYVEQVKPFVNHYKNLLKAIVESNSILNHRYFIPRDAGKTGIIVISSDRGLCGGYNVNIGKKAVALAEEQEDVIVIALGSRINEAFRRENMEIGISYMGISEQPLYEEARMIAARVVEMYETEEISKLYLVHTKFETMIEQYPIVTKLLPLDSTKPEGMRPEYLWEPDLNESLDSLVPDYLAAVIFGGMAEAALSEQSVRVISMDAASKNSDDIIKKLNLEYNQLRQDVITQEIIEIVNGASAVT